MRFSNDLDRSAERLDALLGVGRSLDVVARDLYAGRRRCRLYLSLIHI